MPRSASGSNRRPAVFLAAVLAVGSALAAAEGSLPAVSTVAVFVDGRPAPDDRLAQPFEMEVHAFVEQGVDQRQAEGAAEIARQVEQPGGVLDPIGRHGAQRQIVDRHHA